MELLRLPPFPLTLSYTLPEEDYTLTLASKRNEFMADVLGVWEDDVVTFTLSDYFSRYDSEYALLVYEGLPEDKGDVVVMDTLRVVRPYLNPAEIAPVGQVEEYSKYERVARTMIDNITGGFYYCDETVTLQGSGADYLPIGRRVNKILSVIRNNISVYELDGINNQLEYSLTPDRQSLIVVNNSSEIDYMESPIIYPYSSSSDSFENPLLYTSSFKWGSDYKIRAEVGWPMVPQDIKEATSYLVEDMSCGVPNYWSKYIREYETKDFRVDFQRTMFSGTGNLLVDQILARYLGDTLYDNIRVL